MFWETVYLSTETSSIYMHGERGQRGLKGAKRGLTGVKGMYGNDDWMRAEGVECARERSNYVTSVK